MIERFIPNIMEPPSQILGQGTSPDWYFLKSFCKSNQIPIKTSLFFLDDWISVQKLHLNKSSPEIKFIFYHQNEKYTNLTFPVPVFTCKTPPVKRFLLKSLHKKYIEWEISLTGSIERVLIELDFKSCPRTSENFWQISTNHPFLSYVNSSFHRSVKSCFIEGGMIEGETHSIYGDYFPDENFNYRHSEAGVIGMVKSASGMNGTRFYITLRPVAYFDGKLVAFGKVVEGIDVIRKIAGLTTSNQVIVPQVVIVKSQEFLSKRENVEEMRKTGGFENFDKRKSTGFRELANELLKFV